jgi:hypothetical protein
VKRRRGNLKRNVVIGPFTFDIDNEYFPLTVGKVLVLAPDGTVCYYGEDVDDYEGGAGDAKYYIKGIGLSIDEVAKLVSY